MENFKNPLICPDCNEYRYLSIEGARLEKDNKKVGFKMPSLKCVNCGNVQHKYDLEYYESIAEKYFEKLKENEFTAFKFEYEDKKFPQYDYLGFDYRSEDYYLIPGLERDFEIGFLTPVFFNKDLLLYYNSHPNYSVKLTSFSSGNIYLNGEPFLPYGFGINRNGLIFIWLGDLDKTFKDNKYTSDLQRFKASNTKSDGDIFSKFYLSQLPTSLEDAFQDADNETKIFKLFDKLNDLIFTKINIKISVINIDLLSEIYRPPILEDKIQIFNTYLSLNKYLIENLKTNELKKELIKSGVEKKKIKSLGSLKTFEMFLEKVFLIKNISKYISPLYVLNDLRQLESHISSESSEDKYNFCKERLNLDISTSDFNVYLALIKEIMNFYNIIINERIKNNRK